MANIVTVSGMFGNGKTYFADSPVVIDISGLAWPTDPTTHKPTSPFNIVRINVLYDGSIVGSFHVDTGGQSDISFDISSALRAIWADYKFAGELAAAANPRGYQRNYRSYILQVFTEYLASDGVFTTTQCEDSEGNTDIPGGRCLIGWLTEWERSTIGDKVNADASHWEHSNLRNGDASTKPTSSPERVGKSSITSWADVQTEGTQTVFYAATVTPAPDSQTVHAPIVLRDDIDYQDFLFVNRRGAVETCSALMLEAMNIDVETKSYARIERPSFKPSRSLMSISQGGPRRSWPMSSGLQTREWAEWWAMEFLTARQWWMLYKGSYVPVVVEPAKKSTGIYDRTKQQMPSVEFTVTLALEG